MQEELARFGQNLVLRNYTDGQVKDDLQITGLSDKTVVMSTVTKKVQGKEGLLWEVN